jgi:pyrimidine-nucleoside phosphorylase
MKSVKELLRLRREGGSWSADEVRHFIDGVVDGKVSTAQVGAFLMAVCTKGITVDETTALTSAMAESGRRFRKNVAERPQIDKHSTGGVGDKVSLLLAPLAQAMGMAVPMISGRGLGHTGGTVDKLESIHGFRTDLDHDALQSLLDNDFLFMAAQSGDLAPADRILYGIRDVTGTVENVGLITASILSKKFAEDLDGLVMDVKVGSAAFMRTLPDAHELASSIKAVGEAAGLPITIVFTRMDHPLGRSIGNWVEMVEAERALADIDSADPQLVEVVTELTSHMVLLAGGADDVASARHRVRSTWSSGAGHDAFHAMIQRQGGDWTASIIEHEAVPSQIVEATSSGHITSIKAHALAHAVMNAGGGRLVETDVLDLSAGIEFFVHVGDEIHHGMPIARVTARDRAHLSQLDRAVQHALHTEKAPVDPEPSMILDTWT